MCVWLDKAQQIDDKLHIVRVTLSFEKRLRIYKINQSHLFLYQIIGNFKLCILVLTLLIVNVPEAKASSNTDTKELEKILIEAYKASMENVISGDGVGKYEYFEQKPKGEIELIEQAKAKVLFNKGKYNIELSYENIPKYLSKRIVICDESTIMYSEFWRGVKHPTGAEGYLYTTEGRIRRLHRTLFPWDMSCLPKQNFDAEGFFSKQPKPKVPLQKKGNIIHGSFFIAEKVIFEFEAKEECGFNVTKRIVRNVDRQEAAQSIEVNWKKVDSHWCVDRVVEVYDARQFNKSLRRWVFCYDRFNPNVKVDTSKFTLDALELPLNSRILDQRPNAIQKIYHYLPAGKAEAKLNKLLEQLQTLPAEPKELTPDSNLRPLLLMGLAVFSVLLLCLGLFLWWRQRKVKL